MAVQIQRTFSAPSTALFDAWLDPELVRRWLFVGPDSAIARIESERRVGGRFLIVERTTRNGTGEDTEHYGEYRAIHRPYRLQFTLEVPKYFAGVTVVTVDVASVSATSSVMGFIQTGVEHAVTEDSWRRMFDTLARVLPVVRASGMMRL